MSRELQLREIIREMLKQELEEVSTSDAAGPYLTPMAFSGGEEENERRRKKNGEHQGYTIVPGYDEHADASDLRKES